MPTPPSKGVPVNKRSLKQVFQEAAAAEKKLSFQGPDNIRPDSRYVVTEICEDHVVFKLLGDESFVLPYSGIVSLRVGATSLTIRYG